MKKICGLLFLAVLLSPLCADIGIGTRFGTVVLEKVMPGHVYNLRQLRGVPYTVYNSGSGKTDVSVEVFPPQKALEGYEPIADPGWIRIEPDKFALNPGEEFPCNIILTVPNDKALIGRHFHALLRAQTVGENFYGTSVINNFFFSVGTEGPEAVKKARAKKLLRILNFDVDPQTLFITIPAGEKVDVFNDLDKSIKILNKGRKNLKFRIRSVTNVMRYPPLEGYEFTPDISFIKAKPDTVKVKKYRIADVKLTVKIPEEYKGKKFMFVIAVSPAQKELSLVELYVRVYVTVK